MNQSSPLSLKFTDPFTHKFGLNRIIEERHNTLIIISTILFISSNDIA
ncbi:hypothetical protein [Alkalicoccobacillus porphyridii]|nr:hypothetical protein [Alkalicoccobacillus porphyridii]